MAPPDLNSLPPSRSMSSSPNQPRSMQAAVTTPNRQNTPSPRPSVVSLAATASLNAADISRRSSGSNRGSPHIGRMPSERRRSQVAMNLNLNDPTIPSPGELSSSDRRPSFGQSYTTMSPATLGGNRTVSTGDPHYQRHPSLGEIHNELEQEQEAQVNRMLQMIRDQRLQLDALQRNASDHHSRRSSQPSSATAPPTNSTGNGAAIEDLTPASEHSISFPSIHPAVPPQHRVSRNTSSASRSPALRPLPSSAAHDPASTWGSSSNEWPPSPLDSAAVRRNSIRDENAYYQAETANLTRENQMLRMRIRELEKQITELNALPANSPATPSNLGTSSPVEMTDENAADAEASAAAAIARI